MRSPGPTAIVADQLFATLDPTVRRVKLAGVGEVVLADTVGFVRALPHELVAAFRSTLQEARDADLLLHVVDASDPLRDERIDQVREVLKGIGAGEIRELLVFNKIDLSGDRAREHRGGRRRWRRKCGRPRRHGAGLDSLRDALARAVRPNQVRRTFHLQLQAAAVRSESVRAQCRARRAPMRGWQLGGGSRAGFGRDCQIDRARRVWFCWNAERARAQRVA